MTDRPEPIVHSVNDAIRLSSLKRTCLYELIRTGKLKSKKVGKRRLIDAESLRALLLDAK